MSLFYSNNCRPNLVGYADARYLSDPNKARLQTSYVSIYKGDCHILEIYKA